MGVRFRKVFEFSPKFEEKSVLDIIYYAVLLPIGIAVPLVMSLFSANRTFATKLYDYWKSYTIMSMYFPAYKIASTLYNDYKLHGIPMEAGKKIKYMACAAYIVTWLLRMYILIVMTPGKNPTLERHTAMTFVEFLLGEAVMNMLSNSNRDSTIAAYVVSIATIFITPYIFSLERSRFLDTVYIIAGILLAAYNFIFKTVGEERTVREDESPTNTVEVVLLILNLLGVMVVLSNRDMSETSLDKMSGRINQVITTLFHLKSILFSASQQVHQKGSVDEEHS